MEITITKKVFMPMLGNFVSVKNYQEYANQFVLFFENGEVFQSYSSLIGARVKGVFYFTDEHDYSRTTSKHCTNWCGYDTQERRKGLKEGTFVHIL